MSRKDKKAEIKASSAELRKKEKENRRLQQVNNQLIKSLIRQLIIFIFFQELTTEKEKFNQMVAKYQKDLQDLQVN